MKYEVVVDSVIAGSATTRSPGVQAFVWCLRALMWPNLSQLLAKMFGQNSIPPGQRLKYSK